MTATVRRTVLKYYAYRPTTFPGFFWPILTLYLLQRGLSYTAIATAGTAMAAVTIVGEVPTGYVGDRIGPRNALLVSASLFTVGQGSLLFVDSALGAVVAFGLTGLAETFQSGATEAWLYEVLARGDSEDRYTHVRGRGEAVRRWVGAGMMVLAGPLFVLDPAYPFYATIAVNVASVSILLTFPTVETGGVDRGFDPGDAVAVIRRRLLSRSLRSFVAYAALAVAVVRAADTYIQPIATETLDPATAALGSGFPEAATLGVIYAAFTAVAAVASDRAAAIERHLGTRRLLLAVPAAIAVWYTVVAALPLLAIPAFFFSKSASPVFATVRSRYLNDRVGTVGRATVLSAASLCFALARFPLTLGSGVVADLAGPFVAVAALGGAFLVGAGVLFLIESPFGGPAAAETVDAAD